MVLEREWGVVSLVFVVLLGGWIGLCWVYGLVLVVFGSYSVGKRLGNVVVLGVVVGVYFRDV